VTINYSGGKVTDRLRRAFRTVGRANALLEESLLPVVLVEDASTEPFRLIERGVTSINVVATAAQRQSLAIGMVDQGPDDVLVITNIGVASTTGAININCGIFDGQVDAGFGAAAQLISDIRTPGPTAAVQAGSRSNATPLVFDQFVILTLRSSPINVYVPLPGVWVLTRDKAFGIQPTADNLVLRMNMSWELHRNVS